MKGDFSRDTFRPELQYTRVLAQQGRIDLDADRNEAQALLLERMRLAIIDHFGPFGGPEFFYDLDGAWQRPNLGFQVGIEPAGGPQIDALTLGPGRYYVAGWACTNSAEARYEDNAEQPGPLVFPEPLPNNVGFLVYLDVWERHRTSLEDDSIREVALNGIDTASRAQLVCQVRFLLAADLPAGAADLNNYSLANRNDWWPLVLAQLRGGNPARLRVEAEREEDAPDNPCLAGALASYTGPENQLYRVEIHTVGPNPGDRPTFKFSRNNGSDVAALLEIDGNVLRTGGFYEPSRGFSAGNWVELIDDEREALGQPGALVRVVRVEGPELTIDPDTASGSLDVDDFKTSPKVRRWDQTGRGPLTLKDGAIEIEEGEPIPLEYGIRVTFEEAGGPHTYRTGDYWTFPARYLTGSVQWPEGEFLPPQGVIHYYAPLAAVRPGGAVEDLRVLRDPWA